MYIRPNHRAQNADDVAAAMRDNMFATLVNDSPSGLIASHLPFVVEGNILYAHVARANPHATAVAQSECLVIFNGPHAYVSPSWYEDRATAPTWDYVSIHCYGHARVHGFDDARRNIERLIGVVEAHHARPWSIDELAPADVERMIANIVSFEIPIDRMDAKFKLNQGEKPERTRAAIRELERQGHATLAELMRRYNALD